MKRLESNWSIAAAVASSIAAICGFFLLCYQLYTDKPDLKIDINGTAFADFESQGLYIAVWLDAFNRGRKPAGVLSSKLAIISPDIQKMEFDETPVFPRWQITKDSKVPSIENPFFYEPSYYDDTVKYKMGKAPTFDKHPAELTYKKQIFNVGTYQRGYIIFKIMGEQREKILQNLEVTQISLILKTTDGEKKLPIKKINKWKKETFGNRFFVIGNEE